MTKKDFTDLGISEELAAKAAEASKKELESYVQKSKYDLVVTEKETLEIQIKEHGKQLEELKKAAKGSEELEKKVKELQDNAAASKAKYEKQINDIQLNHAIDTALKEAKAKNAKAVRSLLDMNDIVLDDGKVKGLDKQIKKLQEAEDSKFLFESAPQPEDGKPKIGGNTDNANSSGIGNGSADNGNGSKSIGQLMAEAYNADHVPTADNK